VELKKARGSRRTDCSASEDRDLRGLRADGLYCANRDVDMTTDVQTHQVWVLIRNRRCDLLGIRHAQKDDLEACIPKRPGYYGHADPMAVKARLRNQDAPHHHGFRT
jgi:hypothetical protein